MLYAPIYLEPVTTLLATLILIALACVVWIVMKFVFKITIKIFTIGCLGILVLGAVCGLITWLSSGS